MLPAPERGKAPPPLKFPQENMTLFDSPAFDGHEGVHAFHDEKTGLKAIIAVHSTARGPACGGTRMWDYASSEEALDRRAAAVAGHDLQERGRRP